MAIPKEWYEQIRSDIVVTARRQNVARKLIRVRNLSGGLGVQQYSFDTLVEMSDAVLTWTYSPESATDAVNFTRSEVKVPVLHKEFEINRRDLEASRKFGNPLNTTMAGAAAYKVTNLENELVLLGWASDGGSYDINGLYNAANNSVIGSDFGTAGNAVTTIASAISAMMADDIYPPYNLVLNPTQYAQLTGNLLSGGKDEEEKVRRMIQGDIVVTPFQTDGTGMLLADANAGFFELVVAQDMTVETEITEKYKNLWGIVYECVVPVVYDTNAICKITGI